MISGTESVVGARASVSGYADVAITDGMGNFQLPAHAAEGQVVTVRAEKGRLFGTISVPADAAVEVMVRSQSGR